MYIYYTTCKKGPVAVLVILMVDNDSVRQFFYLYVRSTLQIKFCLMPPFVQDPYLFIIGYSFSFRSAIIAATLLAEHSTFPLWLWSKFLP